MLQDPNVERYVQERIEPLQKQITELQATIFNLMQANNLHLQNVSVSVLSDEEMREPIENALYSTNRFLTTQATDLAEGIIQYIKDAGYTIARTER